VAAYLEDGTAVPTPHVVLGGVVLVGSPPTATVTLSGAAAFVNYVCTAQNTTDTAGLQVTITDGAHFTITSVGVGPITVAYICVGN
jgi:hypothetical protein